MKGLYILSVFIVWGYISCIHVRSEPLEFCDAKKRAFNDTWICFNHPNNCTEDDQNPCQITTFIRTNGNGTYYFSLSGKLDLENETTGWIALGLSTDRKMGNDEVMMCIVDNNGTVTLHHRFNEGRSNRPHETDILSLLTFTDGRLDDDVIRCNFQRSTQKKQVHMKYYEFDLLIPRSWYLFFGIGPTDSSGSPLKHRTIPYISDRRIDFTRKYRITIKESLMEPQESHDHEPEDVDSKNNAACPALGLAGLVVIIFFVLYQITATMFL